MLFMLKVATSFVKSGTLVVQLHHHSSVDKGVSALAIYPYPAKPTMERTIAIIHQDL